MCSYISLLNSYHKLYHINSLLTASHWAEHGDLNGGVRRRTEGAEGIYNPIGRTTISNRSTQNSQGLNYQPKCTYWGIYGSSFVCSRGWPYLTSVGGEALSSVKARCPSVGEFEGGKVCGWVGEYPHKSRGRGGGRDKEFLGEGPGKWITFEI